jgi:dinuclear metal center YbgI/SA1388 family protein
MTVHDLEAILEQLAPACLKLGNDPIGRCIGSSNSSITKIGVALDATAAVISECVTQGINVLVTHHPLIYSPITRLDETAGFPESAVIAAIKAGVTVLSAHTNWDCAEGGINDVLAELLGVIDSRPIEPTPGTDGGKTGIGRLGRLRSPMMESDFLSLAEERLQVNVRCSERRDRMVQTIAVCGGAGESLYASIKDQADIYVTSDVRHHMFVAAYGEKCTLWDAGHRETEVPGTKHLATLLSQHVSVPVTWIAEPNV